MGEPQISTGSLALAKLFRPPTGSKSVLESLLSRGFSTARGPKNSAGILAPERLFRPPVGRKSKMKSSLSQGCFDRPRGASEAVRPPTGRKSVLESSLSRGFSTARGSQISTGILALVRLFDGPQFANQHWNPRSGEAVRPPAGRKSVLESSLSRGCSTAHGPQISTGILALARLFNWNPRSREAFQPPAGRKSVLESSLSWGFSTAHGKSVLESSLWRGCSLSDYD
jgi:hypothetical protein